VWAGVIGSPARTRSGSPARVAIRLVEASDDSKSVPAPVRAGLGSARCGRDHAGSIPPAQESPLKRTGVRSLIRPLQCLVLAGATLLTAAAGAAPAPAVPARERDQLFRAIDAEAPRAVALLEELVNLNSGTFNVAGVKQVGERLEQELRALGFATRWVPMDDVKRAPHLVAERQGRRGQKVLLIGHMDTVFEPFSPFRSFVRSGDTATGPGVHDMKGGLVVMLSALKALHAAKALDDRTITVFITADEEMPGEPATISRGEFVAAGRRADATLCFESGVRIDGRDYVSTARRGATDWRLNVHGKAAHSSGVFRPDVGDGAIYEMARILSRFHGELREPNLTYNVGLAAGGGSAKVDFNGTATAAGKVNIVAADARALGDIRALTPEQLERTKDRMRAILADNLPQTGAEIEFNDLMPPMAPTPRNAALHAQYTALSEAAGLGPVHVLDPMQRGAGDSAWVSPYVATLTGLGAAGSGSHTVNEAVDLSTLPLASKRAALMIRALTR
jgi:glutamate carboxypeptidase